MNYSIRIALTSLLLAVLGPTGSWAAPVETELMGPPDELLQATTPAAEDLPPTPPPAEEAGVVEPDEDVDMDIGEPGAEALEIDLEPGEPPAEGEGSFFSFLDTPHEAVASGFNWLTRNMDAFFANEKVFDQATGSYIRLTSETSWSEGGELHSVGRLKIKLRLPRTQKKLRLVFSSDPTEERDSIDRTVEEQRQAETGFFAGLQRELGKEDGWQYQPSLHVNLKTPVDYLVRVRAFRRFPFDYWSVYFSESIYWLYSIGWASDTQLEFDHQLDANSLFRAASFLRWTDDTDYFTLSEVFSLTHELTERRSLSYQAGVYVQSQPTVHVTDYLLQLRYRQLIHSDYLFMELVPEIRYRKDADFRAEHSLLVRIEMVFSG